VPYMRSVLQIADVTRLCSLPRCHGGISSRATDSSFRRRTREWPVRSAEVSHQHGRRGDIGTHEQRRYYC
jgi:hypothetical protein